MREVEKKHLIHFWKRGRRNKKLSAYFFLNKGDEKKTSKKITVFFLSPEMNCFYSECLFLSLDITF